MPYSAKKNIIENYHINKHCDTNPTDRYRCLAEVKTEPHEFDDCRYLISYLSEEIIFMNNLFRNNGYRIDWSENQIPPETHFKIIREFNKTIELKNDTLQNKKIYTIENDNIKQFYSKDNKRRGGGLHITISGIEDIVTVPFVKELDKTMRCHLNKSMTSVYRNNLLFREKRINDTYLFEYMSYGFSIPQCNRSHTIVLNNQMNIFKNLLSLLSKEYEQ